MTEQEWLECGDPLELLGFLFGPTEEFTEEMAFARKKLLLDCACFSRLVRLVPLYGRLWQAHAAKAADGGYPKHLLGPAGEDANCELQWAIGRAAGDGAGRLGALLDLWTCCRGSDVGGPGFTAERPAQADLLRDIYGNPFRPVRVTDPSCADARVTAVARAIYEADAFDCMDRLVEALEEAGCATKEILEHCRGRGPHVRGCWAVDLLLGKS